MTVGTEKRERIAGAYAGSWVPPPEAPVQASRLASTPGRDSRKSRARMLFQV
jgi:hypothetical protein